jgi:hypothetical protein
MAIMSRKQNVERIAAKCGVEANHNKIPIEIHVVYFERKAGQPGKIRSARYIDDVKASKSRPRVAFVGSDNDDTPHIVQDGMRLAAQGELEKLYRPKPVFIGLDLAMQDPSKTILTLMSAIPHGPSSATRGKAIDNVSHPNLFHESLMKTATRPLHEMTVEQVITVLNHMPFRQMAAQFKICNDGMPKVDMGFAAMMYEDTEIQQKRRHFRKIMDLIDDIAFARFGIGFRTEERR